MREIFNVLFVIVMLLVTSCYQSTQSIAQKMDSTGLTLSKENLDSLVFTNDTISIFQIDSNQFFHQEEFLSNLNTDTIAYIDNFDKVKVLLKNQVTFGGWNDDKNIIDSTIDGQMIAFIRFANGDTINPNFQQYTWDAGFVRYYPSEHILLLEGGHASDFSIDLKQGIANVDMVGNPAYIVSSPQKKHRVNGSFPGQECSDYFLQYQTSEGYKMLSRIPLSLSTYGFDLCTLTDIFWNGEDELYFRNMYFGVVEDKRLGFFRLKIN